MTNPRIRIDTEFGPIHAELFEDAAPITVTNFLHYLDDGLYNSGVFHRAVRTDNQSNANLKVEGDRDASSLPNDQVAIEVIQGTVNPDRRGDLDEPIPLERTSETGLSHTDGTLSMARFGPDSAVADFFICINDQPELDFGGKRNPDGQGFAAFGRVTAGMEIVRMIQHQPTDGQTLQPLITISGMRREG